uniref:SCAN box domain-containing protein n=1 Tax=Junco hyemalis TaxID=40217 RepID=A0A8C5JUD1_JUNHY
MEPPPCRAPEGPAAPDGTGTDTEQRRLRLRTAPEAPGGPGGARTEQRRLRFRQFQYREAAGPRAAWRRLRELSRRWLRPQERSTEQILELLELEQFLSILPERIQSWVWARHPRSCAQAVALAERFQRAQEEREGIWERQVSVRVKLEDPGDLGDPGDFGVPPSPPSEEEEEEEPPWDEDPSRTPELPLPQNTQRHQTHQDPTMVTPPPAWPYPCDPTTTPEPPLPQNTQRHQTHRDPTMVTPPAARPYPCGQCGNRTHGAWRAWSWTFPIRNHSWMFFFSSRSHQDPGASPSPTSEHPETSNPSRSPQNDHGDPTSSSAVPLRSMRQILRAPDPPAQPRADAHGGAAVRLRPLREALRPPEHADHTPAAAHGRAAVPVPHLRQGLHQPVGPAQAPALAHGRAAVPVPHLRQELQPAVQPEPAPPQPHPGEAPPLPHLRQELQAPGGPAGARALAHG